MSMTASFRILSTSTRLITRATTSKRMFSSDCAPAMKLREILSEYRKEQNSEPFVSSAAHATLELRMRIDA